jgi:hypothetical protein
MMKGEQQSHQDWVMLWALLAVAALMPWPLLLGPNNWWAFILATAAIMGVLRLLLGREWRSRAGLKLSPTQAGLVAAAFVLVAMGSRMLLHHVDSVAGLTVDAPNIMGQVGFLFQAFNEEILLRALLIGVVLQYARSTLLVSLGLALVFAAAHFLLYRFSNPMHLALSFPALATLFFAGVAMNNLYLGFRHIGFSWALHAGWNVVWLPAAFYDASTHAQLHEPQIFDRVLGTPIMAAAACASAAVSFVLLARRPLKSAADSVKGNGE